MELLCAPMKMYAQRPLLIYTQGWRNHAHATVLVHVGLDTIFRKQVQAFRTQLRLYTTVDQQVITTCLDR